jgi:hypothetical protein
MAKSKNVVSGKKSQTRYSTWQPIGSFRKCRDVKYQKDPIPQGKEYNGRLVEIEICTATLRNVVYRRGGYSSDLFTVCTLLIPLFSRQRYRQLMGGGGKSQRAGRQSSSHKTRIRPPIPMILRWYSIVFRRIIHVVPDHARWTRQRKVCCC